MKLRSLLLGCAVAAAGCDRTETVSIGLDPDAFDIVTRGTANAGDGSIVVDPNAAGGQDYRDNKSDIDSAVLARLELEIVSVNAFTPANVATQLESGTLEITDESTLVTHRYRVDPSRLPMPIAVTPLPENFHDLGILEPDPSDPAPLAIDAFLSGILKGGHVFTVVAAGTVDGGPVNITCRLHFDINLEISIGIFD